jgi:hypothetical protein
VDPWLLDGDSTAAPHAHRMTTTTPVPSRSERPRRHIAALLAAYWRSVAMVLATEHGWCLAHGAWYPGDVFVPHEHDEDL